MQKGSGGMSTQNEIEYFERLIRKNKPNYKEITFNIDAEKLKKLEQLSKALSFVSGDADDFSQDRLIGLAIDKFLKESKVYLWAKHKIDLDEFDSDASDAFAFENVEDKRQERKNTTDFDTVMVRAAEKDFRIMFMGEEKRSYWEKCNVSDKNIPKVKYIAFYRGAPISGITHYAKIKEIRFDPEKNCKVCYFDGAPIALPHKVTFTGVPTAYFHGGTKYTRLESLLDNPQADRSIFVRMG